MHDPNEPHPWDEEGPPTGELQTHGDTAAGSDPGSDVGGEEPPSFTELDTGGIEDLPAATERSERARAVAIGLLLGAGIGLAIVAILARVAASWR